MIVQFLNVRPSILPYDGLQWVTLDAGEKARFPFVKFFFSGYFLGRTKKSGLHVHRLCTDALKLHTHICASQKMQLGIQNIR